ncbi:hypothetical protein K1719_018262 [Acacia pycnantha]|nr:hypothetical protein K1719_018262 [Acacia pycnantha]
MQVFITFSILISLLFEVLSIAILKDPAVILVTPGPYGLIFASFTRCVPNTFFQVCNNLKGRPEAMRRLKVIGFDGLVDLSCRQINRSLCAQYMNCFDPPVGGCLYFLMLFCFQHFPLGDVIPSPHQSPMAFWTDKNVKRRVSVVLYIVALVKNLCLIPYSWCSYSENAEGVKSPI